MFDPFSRNLARNCAYAIDHNIYKAITFIYIGSKSFRNYVILS